MKVLSVVGARPQFIKASAVSRALRQRHTEILVHTGQHYDDNMSSVFFEELDIPPPDYNLGIGSGPHGAQTGAMLASLEETLAAEKPDWALVYGDTNSTLAGALAAAKLRIPLAHVEAGLRSFNRAMPEEVNRVVTDHLSDLLLCPSRKAIQNLADEGISRGVHLVGDVMASALAYAAAKGPNGEGILERLGLSPGGYLLVTIHRAENSDDPARLSRILDAFRRIREPIVFPVHPRTRKSIELLLFAPPRTVRLIDPVGYLDMVALESSARLILTDSGGIQKEAYWLGVPCVTLREETEWVETVDAGWNLLAGADADRIVRAVETFQPPRDRPGLYGDREGADRIVELLAASGKAV